MIKRFYALDAFRGLAALFVVLYHMPVINGTLTSLVFFQKSSVLVEFFFILSGFVLAHSYARRKLNFKSFLVSRAFRLYPLHLFMLAVFVFLYGVRGLMLPGEDAFQGANSLSELLPNALLIHSWSTNFIGVSFNYPSWSISIEFGLYMIFYGTLYLPSYKLKRLVWGLVGLVFFLLLTLNNIPQFRGLSCFFIGVYIYEVIYRGGLSIASISLRVATVIEVILIIFAVVSISSDVVFYRNVNIAIFSFLVLFFSLELGGISKLLSKPILQNVAQKSYSIYLVHAAVLLVFTWALQIFANAFDFDAYQRSGQIDFGSGLVNNLYVLLQLIVVLVVASLTYKYIEKVGMKFGKKVLNR